MQTFCIRYNFATILKFQINRTNNVANTTAQSCEFCVHHISRTAIASLNIFLYASLMLLNLDLISFWATFAKQKCHFIRSTKHSLRSDSVKSEYITLQFNI
ncbi:hypothetical protein O3M35_000727 [Rhynocoris fuscipes]|uniref:Uncharacterized protein n=1 Tax=Rhynocoris fuscipes TaxID=488301 RepID=A0AAW1DT83_9HEMI